MLGSAQMAEVKPFRAVRYDERRRPARAARRAAVRRDLARAARRAPWRASPYNVVHLTLPDDEEQAGARPRRLARGRRARRGRGAGALVALAGLRRPGRRRAHARRPRRLAAAEPYESRRRPAARAHARAARRRAACACSARRGRSSSRSSSSTTALRLGGPRGSPTSRPRGGDSALAARSDGSARGFADAPAADRRRPPPLRDGARLHDEEARRRAG